MTAHTRNCLFLLLVLLSLSGCLFTRLATTPFENPTFTYGGSELLSTTPSQAMVNFFFIAHNPNKAGIKNALASFELYAEGRKFMTGTNIPFEFIPDGDTRITIPAWINYRDLSPVLGSVVERILAGKKTIPITINSVFSGKPAIYVEGGIEKSLTFEMKFTNTVEIPLMQDRTNK